MLFFFSFFVLKIERNMLCCLVGLTLDLRVRNAQPSWPISIARTSDVSTVPLRVFHLPGQRPDAHRGTALTTPVARQTLEGGERPETRWLSEDARRSTSTRTTTRPEAPSPSPSRITRCRSQVMSRVVAPPPAAQ